MQAGAEKLGVLEASYASAIIGVVSKPRLSADRSPGDALTVEDWETYGRRGRAGQETLPEPEAATGASQGLLAPDTLSGKMYT